MLALEQQPPTSYSDHRSIRLSATVASFGVQDLAAQCDPLSGDNVTYIKQNELPASGLWVLPRAWSVGESASLRNRADIRAERAVEKRRVSVSVHSVCSFLPSSMCT